MFRPRIVLQNMLAESIPAMIHTTGLFLSLSEYSNDSSGPAMLITKFPPNDKHRGLNSPLLSIHDRHILEVTVSPSCSDKII